mmetsp:Transcript_9724/g.19797  ORF Transcript_9724/g.19797 Transcript_9724/m.19797 type:complete len:221 (+) Transcript_9724:311-973(+)
MPSIAATSKIKRILNEKRKREKEMERADKVNDISSRKKPRVAFDDRVKFWSSNRVDDKLSACGNIVLSKYQQDEEGADFSLSIDEDGHLDFSLMTSLYGSVHSPNTEKYTPTTGEYNHELSEELCHSDQDAQEELSFNEINSNRCRSISIESCNGSFMEPLITPPSSPRRICTFLDDGYSEETTICEWPCNLTVDIAITTALESVPPSRRLSQVDLSEWD